MTASSLQVQLFQQIKNKLPGHLSLAEEIATLLEVSTDSAYRRIRGEKPLDLDEIYKICHHYQLSLDGLMNLQTGGFVFSGTYVKPANFQFDQYLKAILQQTKYMTGFRRKKLYYLCKDIPLLHHFQVKELAAFKHFFWMRTFLQTPESVRKKFSFGNYPDELFELGRKALLHYQELDLIEIWNIESIISTIHQIEFYKDSEVFRNEEDIFILYESVEKLVDHLERQADAGYSFSIDEGPSARKGKYEMYYNEVILGDNSILADLDGARIAFLVHSVINVITTRDPGFTDNMYEHIQNLLKKSTLISSVSERERSIFFKQLREMIGEKKRKIGKP